MRESVAEVLLPGFRFHPTDEELVGFYLQRKVQQKTLPFEVIPQLDIYNYDPWDLPKMAVCGDNAWYFFCLRDQKYRGSVRPNRVTQSGFWKATGPDRPICAFGSSSCIGLKKSLVFYKGKASSKATKTDWVMHEFRLPTIGNSMTNTTPVRGFFEHESWSVCRIFRKRCAMKNNNAAKDGPEDAAAGAKRKSRHQDPACVSSFPAPPAASASTLSSSSEEAPHQDPQNNQRDEQYQPQLPFINFFASA